MLARQPSRTPQLESHVRGDLTGPWQRIGRDQEVGRGTHAKHLIANRLGEPDLGDRIDKTMHASELGDEVVWILRGEQCTVLIKHRPHPRSGRVDDKVRTF
jgi:hypothetical protein